MTSPGCFTRVLNIILCPSLLSFYTSPMFSCRIASLNGSMLYGDVALKVFFIQPQKYGRVYNGMALSFSSSVCRYGMTSI